MYKQLTLILLSFVSVEILAQEYFQQQVDYTLDVELIPLEDRLIASGTLTYTNNSNETLNDIFLHVWANGYSSDESEFAKQQIRIGQTKFHFRDNIEPYGYRKLNLTQGVRELSYSNHEGQPDVLSVSLEDKILPGESATINMEFEVKIPPFFSRMGAQDGYYQITQWYPKPAVFDKDGWHPMPYLDLGEFYSEFGEYEVNITVPEEYVVAATGVSEEPRSTASGKKTYSFAAEKVHDFAWCAYNNFKIKEGQVVLDNGQTIKLYVYEVDEYESWERSLEYLEQAIVFYSANVANYPYPQATVVQSPGGTGGGMEYPMLTTIDTHDSNQGVDHVIAHEVGHNWFYGILATNERTDAWMDEGMNSFFDHKYNDLYYESGTFDSSIPKFFQADTTTSFLEKTVVWQCKRGRNQACRTHSNDMNGLNYGFSAYEFPAWSFNYLEDFLGDKLFDKCIKNYYEQWQFKHPQPDDLKQVFESTANQNLDWFFEDLLGKAGFVDHSLSSISSEQAIIKNKGQLAIPVRLDFKKDGEWIGHQWTDIIEDESRLDLSIQDYDELYINGASPFMDVNPRNNHKSLNGNIPAKAKLKFSGSLDDPKKNEIYWLPSFTWNHWSKFMLGFHLYNSSFPQKRTRVHAQIGYSFHENRPSWILNLEHDYMLKSPKFRKLTFSVNHRKFSFRKGQIYPEDLRGNDSYYRTEPSLRLFFTPDYKNRKESWLTYKYIHLFFDEIYSDRPNEANELNHFHELSYNFVKKSVINPLSIEIKGLFHRYDSVFEEGEKNKFLKLTASLNGKLKYTEKSWFSYRVFAGFFPINSSRDVNSYNNVLAKGSLNLSYNSFADVSYASYWLGRGVQSDWTEKQFIYEEGGFKTPLIYNNGNVGKSNNALVSVNLKSDIPIPLFRVIPIKPYADFGYYSTPVQSGTSDRKWEFDYDAGLALEFLDGAIGIYFPLLQSDRIRQVYDAEETVRKISFQIDLRKLKPWDLIDRLEM